MNRRSDAQFGPKEAVLSVVDAQVGGVSLRLYTPLADEALPMVVYLHGGGWVLGSLDTHDGVCRALANRAGSRVVSVDYRLAPEHRFPAAVDDAWIVTRWAFEQATRVAVAGDSAGGSLAAVMALRSREACLPLALQALLYPVTDHSFDTPSYASNADGYGLTRADMRWYWDQYLDGADGRHPDASPLQASSLAGVAPALVLVCGLDPLRDEGIAFAERLRHASVSVEVLEFEDMIHDFLRKPAHIDRAREGLDQVGNALRRALQSA